MAGYEAIVFDLDGTLLDTLEDLADSVNAALKDYGCPPRTLDQVRADVGNGIRNLIIRSIDQGEAHPKFEHIFEAFREHYKANCRNKTKPYDGVKELLGVLRADGRKLAIVSNKADFAVKELNEYYFGEFDMMAIGEREGIARKPAPDTVFEALRGLGVLAEHAVYVGDSDVDIKTARAAGLPCISVLWGFRSRDFLLENGAVQLAQNAEELLKLLQQN